MTKYDKLQRVRNDYFDALEQLSLEWNQAQADVLKQVAEAAELEYGEMCREIGESVAINTESLFQLEMKNVAQQV